ncbi:MAG: T9SS type A sorting domain-containing protein [Anaerolineae bacterium]|nr:T9SS type A sorting domain-containing protein [Anaerolineae bacterium]
MEELSTGFFNGLVDEVDIYNRALSASEIQSIYTAGSAGKCQPPPPSCVNPPSGLVSWWPGEDNANDIQSNNHGTLQNGATFAAGKVGQAFSLDGVDDIVRISNVAAIEVQQFTIEAWVFAESPGFHNDALGGIIASKDIGDTSIPPYVSWGLVGPGNTNKFHADIGFTDGSLHFLPSTNSFPFNTFHHVAATWDGSTLKLYVNGQLEGELNLGPKTVAYSGEALTIGEHNVLPAQRAFDGLIDEVDFYNRALSAAEIQSIYNAGSAGKCNNTPPPVCVNPPSGLVSWWPGDDNANDIKGSNHGTLQNGATFASGKVGQAFSLDGIDDFVLIPHNSNLALGSGQDFTIDAWINLQAPVAGHDDEIVAKWDVQNSRTDPSHNFYRLFLQRDIYKARLVLGSAGVSYELESSSAVPRNQWTHVIALREGNVGRIYVNGVLDASAIMTAGIVANSDPLAIGGVFDTFFSPPVQVNHTFGGLIDEVDIYSRALTASEIQSLYNAGSAGKCKECTPPEVSITGNESVCPNTTHTYTANTNAANPTFEWSVTGGTINGDNTGSSVSVTAGGAGTMAVSVEVTDGATNCSNSVTQNVTVEDNQAPVITAAINPITLWPPNHQYVTINVSQCVASVTDNCATLATNNVIITKVTSDEPEDAKGGGDGNTKNDMVIAANCQSVQLRSEREGSGNGRVYTIHLSVNDGNGNTGTATCLVTVPKSQNGNLAVDDGAVYTVTCSCNGLSKDSKQDFTQESLPEGYALEQNYPNPFNPATSIAFSVKETGVVQLTIYNLHGQEVRTLINSQMNAGFHSMNWDGKDERGQVVPSGVYLYKLRVNGFAQTRKMTFMK